MFNGITGSKGAMPTHGSSSPAQSRSQNNNQAQGAQVKAGDLNKLSDLSASQNNVQPRINHYTATESMRSATAGGQDVKLSLLQKAKGEIKARLAKVDKKSDMPRTSVTQESAKKTFFKRKLQLESTKYFLNKPTDKAYDEKSNIKTTARFKRTGSIKKFTVKEIAAKNTKAQQIKAARNTTSNNMTLSPADNKQARLKNHEHLGSDLILHQIGKANNIQNSDGIAEITADQLPDKFPEILSFDNVVNEPTLISINKAINASWPGTDFNHKTESWNKTIIAENNKALFNAILQTPIGKLAQNSIKDFNQLKDGQAQIKSIKLVHDKSQTRANQWSLAKINFNVTN